MGIKSLVAKIWANKIHNQTHRTSSNAVEVQQKLMHYLVKSAKNTEFGTDCKFSEIKNYLDFKNNVPLADYEDLKLYIDKVVDGKANILWPNKPTYLAKTSGTTSGVKYIPISKESMPYHIAGARNALLSYVYHSRNASFIDGKLIFLSGSPILTVKKGIYTGRLSGIVNHHVPAYLRSNQMPSYDTNCIEDWEDKLDKIVAETYTENMTLISGIPPWIQMYFDRLSEKTGKNISQLFPNFKVMVQGGVNFEPYKSKLLKSIGTEIDIVETYPASEGFIAYQDNYKENGLLLILDGGIFYEFIKLEDYNKGIKTRIDISQAELDVNYVLIMNTNAGMWGYIIGDTIKFTSLSPHKIVVTGRIKHFISAFGEHVIAEEVEFALNKACKELNLNVVEFTVAPQINPKQGLPHHEWFVEFDSRSVNISELETLVDQNLQEKNIYYKDLRAGNILNQLKIKQVINNGFIQYMKGLGKLGGQNKLPRLSNNRIIAEELTPYTKEVNG
ncbi:MAG: GH3 auxin-responsive promoter family protein [Bacteroidota bacterium]|nr:GH3 auxin-responsive promoter family protein [Bacteroidota bacterium]